MFRLDADKPVEFCDGLRRRDFLHAGSLSMLGLGLNELFGLKALGAVDNAKPTNGSGVEKGNRRRSISLALRISA